MEIENDSLLVNGPAPVLGSQGVPVQTTKIRNKTDTASACRSQTVADKASNIRD